MIYAFCPITFGYNHSELSHTKFEVISCPTLCFFACLQFKLKKTSIFLSPYLSEKLTYNKPIKQYLHEESGKYIEIVLYYLMFV